MSTSANAHTKCQLVSQHWYGLTPHQEGWWICTKEHTTAPSLSLSLVDVETEPQQAAAWLRHARPIHNHRTPLLHNISTANTTDAPGPQLPTTSERGGGFKRGLRTLVHAVGIPVEWSLGTTGSPSHRDSLHSGWPLWKAVITPLLGSKDTAASHCNALLPLTTHTRI